MAKFVVVDKAPEQLRKEEFVIEQPSFMEEIKENSTKAPRGGRTAPNHLRYIVGSIGQKYDPELTAWSIRPHQFEGRAFASDEELSKIVVELLHLQYPAIFERYVAAKIKARPNGTKLIYYVGPFNSTAPFFQNGIDKLEEKDIETYLGLKPKKVVGKPAVTKEDAESTENQ